MNIDEKLTHLKEAMNNSSLKDVTSDKQKISNYVFSKKQKRFSLFNNPKRTLQITSSIVGVIALCVLMVYTSIGGKNYFNPADPSEQPFVDPFVSKDKEKYQVVVVHSDSSKTDTEWNHLYKKQPIEEYVSNTRVLNKDSNKAQSLISRYTHEGEETSYPLAFVFNSKQMVYKTSNKGQLKTYLTSLHTPPTEKSPLGEYMLAGITLGQPFQKVVDTLGRTDDVFKPSEDQKQGPIMLFREKGSFAINVMLDDNQHTVNGIHVYVDQLKTEEWKEKVPSTKQESLKTFGNPQETKKYKCQDDSMCTIHKYNNMYVRFKANSDNIAYIEYLTPERQRQIQQRYLSKEKGKYYIVLIQGEASNEGISEWDDVMREQLSTKMTGYTSSRGPVGNFDFWFVNRYNVKRAPVAVVTDTEGMVFKAHTVEELKDFFEGK
ncbi:hypothetical protein GLW08_19135 [Pontibacillus yanchengensis]|uniref:Uncharacterized protein n=2 Tax=Pontibacillus yanchengensis TaxID=462910 RepID=A0ACC7VL49_9BACI|nr:hypothetical protein [Pontibacillus yanchengensis]MYL33670.1 hypothetical protein [Pontibacillus yanchengensis]MYL55432.1 hypothetical protein [Pontibacillus yanchengensis]